MDWLLRSSRTLLWLQHIGASDLGATGEDGARLPIEELDEALSKETGTVRPEHIGLVREAAASSLLHRYSGGPSPPTEADARKMVELALRFRDLDKYCASLPTVSERCRITRTHNLILTRAYVRSQQWSELHRQMEFWHEWEQRWEKEKNEIEKAEDEAVRNYWLAGWMGHRATLDLHNLAREPLTGPADRERMINRLKDAIQLIKNALFLRRRVFARGVGKVDDGYETLAQGLSDQVNTLFHITDCWPVIARLGDDPPDVGVVQMTVVFAREIKALWERARRVLRPRETLSRFYVRCARPAAYAKAIEKLRENPARPLHEVQRAAEEAFRKWVRTYPFEATRDPAFNAETHLAEIQGTIQRLEGVLRIEARRWRGE